MKGAQRSAQEMQAITLMFEDGMGNDIAIKMMCNSSFSRAMHAYYDRHAIQHGTLLFKVKRTGTYLQLLDTPTKLGLVQMDVVSVSRGTDEV